MKTKWFFLRFAALLPVLLLSGCVTGPPYYAGSGYGGFPDDGWGDGYGGYWAGGGVGWRSGAAYWPGGWHGPRAVCPQCRRNPCCCRRGEDHDHGNGRSPQWTQPRSAGSGGSRGNEGLFRLKDAEKDEPKGWHSKEWFADKGYKFSRNTWETRGGRSIQGSEIRKQSSGRNDRSERSSGSGDRSRSSSSRRKD